MRTSDVTQLMDLALGLWFPFVRIMAFLRYVPVLDNSALTVRVRIILSLALAIIITPLIPHPIPHDLLSLNSLILTVEQILWGMLFGLMFQFLFLALQLAGQILSFNMGMSMAVMNDPSFCSFRLYHQECDGKQEKNDPGKQINNESNLITKCDNSVAKVMPPGYRY